MSHRAVGNFKIDKWEQTPYGDAADGVQLGRATVEKTFHGDLEGTSTTELLMCGGPDSDAGYVPPRSSPAP